MERRGRGKEWLVLVWREFDALVASRVSLQQRLRRIPKEKERCRLWIHLLIHADCGYMLWSNLRSLRMVIKINHIPSKARLTSKKKHGFSPHRRKHLLDRRFQTHALQGRGR